jgi:putative ABC transport system ATP-binding protein
MTTSLTEARTVASFDAAPGSTGTPILSARDLRKSFGLTEALRQVNLDIQPGEVLAIMGPSGSGKSTLLHCLAGVLSPDEGTVVYQGADTPVSAMSEEERSRLRLTDFGFIFQFGQLLPDLTAIDNVSIPLLLRGTKRRDALRTARSWLDRLGLAGMEDKRPAALSGGQAQRVAIARALVNEPRIIFADEPTGSLDSLSAENVMTIMLDIVREMGTTVVIITHDPRTAAYADREVIVRDGTIATSDWQGRS